MECESNLSVWIIFAPWKKNTKPRQFIGRACGRRILSRRWTRRSDWRRLRGWWATVYHRRRSKLSVWLILSWFVTFVSEVDYKQQFSIERCYYIYSALRDHSGASWASPESVTSSLASASSSYSSHAPRYRASSQRVRRDHAMSLCSLFLSLSWASRRSWSPSHTRCHALLQPTCTFLMAWSVEICPYNCTLLTRCV